MASAAAEPRPEDWTEKSRSSGEPRVHLRREAGVTMCIAIDSLRRGPALGGCRWLAYPSEAAAIEEARALAAAMTRKAALADLPLGGGKAVVLGDPAARTPEQVEAFARFVDALGGDYITAEDMGTTPAVMAAIAERTEHVAGLPESVGGCGDPSPHTARGVFLAIRAALTREGRSIEGACVAVQGVGAVGGALVGELLAAGARVVATDADPKRLAALPETVRRVAPSEILEVDCDVQAPCGPPGVIGAPQLATLRCAIVCGAANNPLTDAGIARDLADRGILFVPDFLANAGGLIHLLVAREGGDAEGTRRRLEDIPRNLALVLDLAAANDLDPLAAAERLVAERLA